MVWKGKRRCAGYPKGFGRSGRMARHTMGGVCIWIQDTFLSNFQEYCWEIVEEGRVAVLRLRGDQGEVDIVALYFSANNSAEW